MTIRDEDLDHLAGLARLELVPEERAAIREDLSALLAYFDQLGELDTDGVEELVRPVARVNVFREDRAGAPLGVDEALALAVEEHDGFFKVPRTVDESA